jgi:hypothetical protein
MTADDMVARAGDLEDLDQESGVRRSEGETLSIPWKVATKWQTQLMKLLADSNYSQEMKCLVSEISACSRWWRATTEEALHRARLIDYKGMC